MQDVTLYILIGFINLPRPKEWVGTKIHVKHGQIESSKYTLPLNFDEYLKDRARNCSGFYSKISQKQANKINKNFDKDPLRLINAETWKALQRDVEMFGEDTFNSQDKIKE